jgi:hypothetical protein
MMTKRAGVMWRRMNDGLMIHPAKGRCLNLLAGHFDQGKMDLSRISIKTARVTKINRVADSI